MWFRRKNNQGDCRVNTDDPRTDAASQARRLRRLLEASRLLNSTLELRELTEIVLRIIQDELPVERCTLFVLDPHQKVLRSLLAQGVEELEIVLAMGEGLAGTVAATGAPLDIPDAYADARFHPGFDRRLNFRTRDALSIPLFNRGNSLVAVLQLLNRQRALHPDEQEFLADMGTYIGIAVHNARLYRELKERNDAELDLRRVRERLAQAEKQSALSEFVAGVVHEIKNPLTVAKGQCFLFRSETEFNASMEARLGKIETSIANAVTIAQNFLTAARQSNTQETTDVNHIIRQTIDLMIYELRSSTINLSLDLDTLPLISADSANLQQVLLNILKNAVGSARERGDDGVIAVQSTYRAHNHSICIEISDNGAGIPEELQPRIFQPFFSTKPSLIGTGLGLAISKRIVEQHQGTLSFHSVSGVGTTFSIELPVQQSARVMKQTT
jgi:signal transduction histidine kinase